MNTELLLDSHFESAGCGEKAKGWMSHRGHMEDTKGNRKLVNINQYRGDREFI